jgi:hypothetical protein
VTNYRRLSKTLCGSVAPPGILGDAKNPIPTMNSHLIIAALGMIAWYLITPPSMPNGQLDSGAPLGRWDRQQSFSSSDECKNGRERLLNLQAGPGTSAWEMAEMKRAISAASPHASSA